MKVSYDLDLAELPQLITAAEQAAKEYADGHLSVFRFTNHWKVMLGTICAAQQRDLIRAAPPYPTFEEALRGLVATLPHTSNTCKFPPYGPRD